VNPDLIDVGPDLAFHLLENSGFNTTYMAEVVHEKFEYVVDTAINSMYPDPVSMLLVPLYVTLVVAVINSLWLSVSCIPSMTTTILELRSGVIPSLKSRDFQKYREAPDTVTLLTGSLFWGCLVSSLVMGLVIGFVAFLLLWQGSSAMMINAVIVGVAACCIAILKALLTTLCCGRRLYSGLYRAKPASWNISMLALERAKYVRCRILCLMMVYRIMR